MKPPRLVLFAKTPCPGQVKTRLVPPLTNRQACEVAMLLIELTLDKATRAWPGQLELSLWPDGEDEHLVTLAKQFDVSMTRQSPGGLGIKMHKAIAAGLKQGHATAIMGCDVPHCPATQFQSCFEQLQSGRNVIGPTRDGGYYLVGANRHHPAMFDGVAWGTATAFNQTLAACRAAGIEFHHQLACLQDLDTHDDLQALAVYDSRLKSFLVK